MTSWLRELALVLAAPGWQQRHRRYWLAAILLTVGVGVPLVVAIATFVSGRTWVSLSLDRTYLAWLEVGLACAFVARAVALGVWLGGDDRSRDRVVAATGASVVIVLVFGLTFVTVARARADIGPVFTPIADGGPLFDAAESPETSVVPTATTVAPTTVADTLPVPTLAPVASTTTTIGPAPKPARPRSGVDPARVEDVYNVLLLGGDAGPGRSGLRTDTMMLLSVHTPSGRASLISVARDMRGILFPPGSALEARYPYGFTKIANSVYPTVSVDDELRAAYEVDDIRPGVVATAQAIGYSLDVSIHDYVLIDMQGFLDLIDALGGVTVNVPKRVPMPGNIPGASTQYPDTIGPGTYHMDGTTALGYVRSRKADSDYQRTGRQRALLAALATQISLSDVIGNYGSITNAVGGTLRTSLTPDELANLLALIGGETAIVESVGLVPPLVQMTDHPDFQQMAEIVGEVRLAIAEGYDSGY